MSAVVRVALRDLQFNSIALWSSVVGASAVQFFFPAFDESRNIALQTLEGIVAMVFHYIFSYELFVALVPPQYNAVSAMLMVLCSPIMVPQALRK